MAFGSGHAQQIFTVNHCHQTRPETHLRSCLSRAVRPESGPEVETLDPSSSAQVAGRPPLTTNNKLYFSLVYVSSDQFWPLATRRPLYWYKGESSVATTGQTVGRSKKSPIQL